MGFEVLRLTYRQVVDEPARVADTVADRSSARCRELRRIHEVSATPAPRVEDMAEPVRQSRAVPARRQQPRLPGVLRPAGVDRDLRRAADQRDLRLCVDAGEGDHRAPAGGARRRLGRRDVGAREHLPGIQGASALAPGPARRAVAASDAAGRGVRLHERQGRRLGGRRRDRLAGPRCPRAGDPGDGRIRRPRRLPAGHRRRAGDDHLARDHRHPGLRPRRGSRALRRSARAGHRPDRAEGRHLRQHPRRPGDRRQDRRDPAAGVRLPRGGAGQRRQGLRRETQAEPGRARRRRPRLEGAGDAAARRRDGHRPRGGDGRRARPRRPAGVHPRVRAASDHGAPRGGAARGGAGPGTPGRAGVRGRGEGGHDRRARRRRDRAGDRRRRLGGSRRQAGRPRRVRPGGAGLRTGRPASARPRR